MSVTPPCRTRVLLQGHLILRMPAPNEWTPHPLIPASGLLDPQTPPSPGEPVTLSLGLRVPQPALVALVVGVTAAAAAAHAEHPEERRGPGEDDAEPDGDEGAAAEGEVDVIGVEQAAQGAEEGGEEDCAGEDCGEGEEGGGLRRVY